MSEGQGGKEKKLAWLVTATSREVQEFIHIIPVDRDSYWYQRARVQLDIRLAEDAEGTAQKLVTGTNSLITETKTLVNLTHRLYILTIVLIALGAFEFIKFILGLFCHAV